MQVQDLVVITGVGYRRHEGGFPDEDVFASATCKPNIGAAVALELAAANHPVVIVARSQDKLERVRSSILHRIPTATVIVEPADLSRLDSTEEMVGRLPPSVPIHIVHSAGLAAGGYALAEDNPYLPITSTPLELPTLEFDAVVRTLLVLAKTLLPRLREQARSKIIVVSSMSGIRTYPRGYAHASAKAGLHHAVRTLALELNQESIYVTEINPGIVNTGLYDPPSVADTTVYIAKKFGYDFDPASFPQLDPLEVGRAVRFVLESEAHILTINLVPFGQYPHTGS
jgi:NAD(P)-dependent dehydrogenase (short-subunit alcohol dehydrogenase family)